MRRSTPAVLVFYATALLAVSLAVWAQPDPAKARHDAMEQMNDAMKELAKMAKGQAPFEAAAVSKQASAISERLEAAEKLFPPGSEGGHAKPEIWSERAGFEKALQDAQAAAAALQAVEDEAAFKPALGRLGQSCQACHDKYRMADHQH